MAALIVLGCALGGCAPAAAPPSTGPAADTPVQSEASAEAPATGQPAVKPSAIATPTTELDRRTERFGGIPTSDSTPVAPSQPRLSVGKALGVVTTRIVRDDSSDGAMPPANCEVRILYDKPAGKTREVATLNVKGTPAQHEDILSLLKRQACAAGANAVLIKSTGRTSVEGAKVDQVEAVALIVGTPKPPVDPSPVPKTITVTPEGPAVPKTITVDPDASP